MIETAARGAQFLLAVGIAYIIALWFALAAWTFRDIEARSRSVFTQVFSTLLVVLFFIPGLLLYLVLRPKETLDQAFQRALEEEYLLQDLDDLPLCPHCQRSVDPEFVLCPHCRTTLKAPCPACGRLIDERWQVCPYCAVTVDRVGSEQAASGVERIGAGEIDRRSRRERALAAAAQRVGLDEAELDAISDALSAPDRHAAVGAESLSTALSRRLASVGDLARVRARAGSLLGQEGEQLGSNGVSAQTPAVASESEFGEEGFWSEPLPTRDRGRGDDQTR